MDLAQVFIVGQLESEPMDIIYGKNEMYTDIMIQVARPFKNTNGEIVYDHYAVSFWKGAGMDLKLYGKKGCTVCISGRIETRIKNISGIEISETVIVAEKCTFSM